MKKIVVHPDVSLIETGDQTVQIRSPNRLSLTSEDDTGNLINLLRLLKSGMDENALMEAKQNYSEDFVDAIVNELLARGILIDENSSASRYQFQSLMSIYDIGGRKPKEQNLPGTLKVKGSDELAMLASDTLERKRFATADGPNLNIIVSGSNDLDFLLEQNEQAINRGEYSTFLRWREGEFLVGPFVVPGHTSCLLCAETRLVANSLNPKTSKYVLDHKLSFSGFRGGSVLDAFAQGLLERHLEAITTGSWGLAKPGSILRFDPLLLDVSEARILKLPNCPACGLKTDRPEQALRDLI